MKSIFVFLVSFMLLISAQAMQKIKQEEFQYVHCVVAKPQMGRMFNHYVVDIRDENQHKLYTAVWFKDTKVADLKNLRLIDDNLAVNTLPEVDVSWISESNGITFKLNILDNGGYSMDGTLTRAGVETPVSCVDSSLE